VSEQGTPRRHCCEASYASERLGLPPDKLEAQVRAVVEALTAANDTLQGLNAYLASADLDDWHWHDLSTTIGKVMGALTQVPNNVNKG